ncbi:MAG: carbamoyltransferase HypF, partial [Chitinophagales bacterium]
MTFHLHIKGRVQGIGFRPQIFKCAVAENISGFASNDADGVHVYFNTLTDEAANIFSQKIIQEAPSLAIIRSWTLSATDEQSFSDFSIRVIENNVAADVLIAPDFAMCPECKQEFHDPLNRRYQYGFITCTLCGPRYSIMKQLPYERHLTTMEPFTLCNNCKAEYEDVHDRRYFSQTNSCPDCGVRLSWHANSGVNFSGNQQEILQTLLQALSEGKIIAVKGIGGFLLMCDASNQSAIQTLRQRKQRPKKPFAVLFPELEIAREYVKLHPVAIHSLLSEAAPIVLLKATKKSFEELDMNGIAPGLSTIGVMLPYAPLLEMIGTHWKKPLIATSGNLSGSCIVFQSENKQALFQFADFILDHNRSIVVPQDDSVIRFGQFSHQPILLRRSRGLAPAIISETTNSDASIFAAGAMMKSAFAIYHNHQFYLSQYSGNLESYDAQQNYLHTFHHFEKLLALKPSVMLADLHPDYPSTKIAEQMAVQLNVPIKKIQHHEAHFAAILGEHDLFRMDEKILGIIWDGTGLGSDGNSWGGEFFIYEKGNLTRAYYLEPIINLAGDKIAKEPRIAALAIAGDLLEAASILRPKFSDLEWNFYRKAFSQPAIQTSSVGRYFDGVASLLNLVNMNSYEGEAALLLEKYADDYFEEHGPEIIS